MTLPTCSTIAFTFEDKTRSSSQIYVSLNERVFMDRGEVHSLANATAADLVKGLVFMSCLLFTRNWYWLVLFQQISIQTLWLPHWFLGIIWFF